VYPSTFLSRGFAFCGATVDGTVTLWDVKLGDRLQSVQHLRASMPLVFPFVGAHLPEVGATLHAVAVRFALQFMHSPCRPSRPSSSTSRRFTRKRGVVSCSLQRHLMMKSGSGTRCPMVGISASNNPIIWLTISPNSKVSAARANTMVNALPRYGVLLGFVP